MKARNLLPLSTLALAATAWTKAPAVARSWEFVATFGLSCAAVMIATEIALRVGAGFGCIATKGNWREREEAAER